MNATQTSLRDPRILAREIRELASRAYKTVHDPLADVEQTRELSRRITDVQGVIAGWAADDLSQWLENLRRRVDAPPNPMAAKSSLRRPGPAPSEGR